MARNRGKTYNPRNRQSNLFRKLTRLLSGPIVNFRSQLPVQNRRRQLDNFKFKNFIYTSSCAIYGNQKNLPITEDNHPNPPSMYAAQKLFSENMVHLHLSHIGKPSTCLRLFNTYGIGQSQRGKYPNVLASLIRTYNEKGYVEITGDGTQTRDFIHVEDVVDAFIKSMSIDSGNHIFNVCSGREISLNYLASMITDDVRYIPERRFDIYKQVASYNEINKRLGWKPTKVLEDEIIKILQS